MIPSLQSAADLHKGGISAEVIDLRTVKPWDRAIVFESVKKTGRLVVVDGGWSTSGFAAEVSAVVSENMFGHLRAPIRRVTLPDSPAPASRALEHVYYPKSDDVSSAVHETMNGEKSLKRVQ
jgi:pyruvate/2-oxoglutarate/acetoin dehydrogenase E1 component